MNYYFELNNESPRYRSMEENHPEQYQIVKRMSVKADRIWIESSGMVWMYKNGQQVNHHLPPLTDYEKKEFIKVKLSSVSL